MSLSRGQLQLVRWTSAALSMAIVLSALIWKPDGGLAVLAFFGFMIIGAPAALITLHLMELKSKEGRR